MTHHRLALGALPCPCPGSMLGYLALLTAGRPASKKHRGVLSYTTTGTGCLATMFDMFSYFIKKKHVCRVMLEKVCAIMYS